MDINIQSIKINLHTKIGDLNTKRLETLKQMVMSQQEYLQIQEGLPNAIVFINPDHRRAFLVSDSQLHFSVDQYDPVQIENDIKSLINYSKMLFDKFILPDTFMLSIELIGHSRVHGNDKKGALNQSITKFTSINQRKLKEELGDIKMVGLRFANEINKKSYDSRIEPLTADYSQFYIQQLVTYIEQQELSNIRSEIISNINYFSNDFFNFLKDSILI